MSEDKGYLTQLGCGGGERRGVGEFGGKAWGRKR